MTVEAPAQIEIAAVESPIEQPKTFEQKQEMARDRKATMATQFPPTQFTGVDLSPREQLTGLASTNRDLIEEYIMPKLEYLVRFRRLQREGRIGEIDPETKRIAEELSDEVALVRDNRRILAEANRRTNGHETVSPRTVRQAIINSPEAPTRTFSQTLKGFQIEVSGTPSSKPKQPAGIL